MTDELNEPTMFYGSHVANGDYHGLDLISLLNTMCDSSWDFPSAMRALNLPIGHIDDDFVMHPDRSDAARVYDYLLEHNEETCEDLNRDEFLDSFPLEWDT